MNLKARKIFLIAGVFISVISACLGLETHHNNHLGWALLFTATIFCASGAITLARNDHLQDIGLILFAGGLSFYLLMIGTQAEKPVLKPNPNIPSKSTGLSQRIINWACRPGFASLALVALGLSIGYSSMIGLLMAVFVVLPGLVIWMRSEDHRGM